MGNTAQRTCVLESLKRLGNHPTATQIWAEARREMPSIGLGTVYRNLETLSKSGIILHISIPDGADRYDHNTFMHDHFVCDRCHCTIDMPHTKIDYTSGMQDGKKIMGHVVLYHGLCPDCAKAK